MRLSGTTVIAVLASALLLGCKAQQPATAAAQTPSQSSTTVASEKIAPIKPMHHVSGDRAFQYTKDVVALGPRPVGSPAHKKLEAYLRSKLKNDHLEEDAFTAKTPAGPIEMRNFVAKFPGTKDGVIVIAGHYDTKPLKNFVGANDGGSSTGLPLALADELRAQLKNGKREGYSVYIALLDGEEANSESNEMNPEDSLYGTQHLLAKWRADGTLPKIKAFILADMIGDADLQIDKETNSTPWLQDIVYHAASDFGYQSHFLQRPNNVFDDHIPFVKAGVPSIDLIDFDYGYNNAFWHTPEDTMDKLSPQSFQIVGDTILQTIAYLDAK